ncbi:pyrimidine utilization protein D [Corticibacter populi]|uniref:Putative carbamate hydrolase RutD n=1 Tax=Corticibacter populi TaxID=1550736 RepID=A0A3M6QPG2_9BURK|nr:pyrimidine utilization protein D [Corticibacter populi]RMX04936.1 pyrimidine utilization protein D [Corticibacter populi]RZS33639.1 aminoacrylate hydrolase [Corticibacter populi]
MVPAYDIHPPAAPRRGTVLLASGLGGVAGFWGTQIEPLRQAGFEVITYDQRGTGRSRAELPQDYRIEDMAADVLAVLDAAQVSQCHLVGHALGGLVGLQLALQAPDRIASLVLVNAWAGPNPHSARCFKARLALLDAVGPRAYVEAQPIFLYPAAWSAEHADQVQAEVEHALQHFPGAATMKARIAALSAFDVVQRLPDIAAPALVMATMDDVLVPWTRSRQLADGLPHATLALMPHGGHANSVTDSGSFNAQLIDYLQGLAQP